MTDAGAGDPGAAPRPLALVTGGWRRIGAAIARALAADGWDLALHARTADALDEGLVAELAGVGAEARGVVGDLADPEFAATLVETAAAGFARPPALLVNSASTFADDKAQSVTAEALERNFRVNLFAPMLLTRSFAAALGEAPGSVVMIVDQRVRNPVPDQFSYSLSKQALHASVRTLARSLAPRVRVNAVAPGLVLPTDDFDAAQWDRLARMMPLARLATPDEIAAAVAWLARAGAVTGQTVFVDAGANMEAYVRDFVYLGK